MRLTSDQRAALALIALAVVAYGITYSFDEVPAAISQGMGPTAFPRLVAIVIMLLSVWLFIAGRRGDEPLERIDPVVFVVIAGAIGFMGVVWLVGITVAMGIAILALGLVWGERRRLALTATAVLLPAAIWLLFVKGLKVTLPVGVLGQTIGF